MATRNLTRRFLDSRNASRSSRSRPGGDDISISGSEASASNLLTSGGPDDSWVSAKSSLPPIWVDRVEHVEEDISKIQSKMKKLSTLHSKRLMVDFQTDESEQEREIDAMTRDVTTIFRHAEGLLKRFGKQGDESKISQSEKVVRNNMQRSIAKKLQGLSGSFRQSQKEYLARMSAQKSGSALPKEFQMGSKHGTADLLDTGGSGSGGFSDWQEQELEQSETMVNQRDQEIMRIAKSIEELAAIFKELAVLVIDQGTILDRIDYNMEMTVDHTKEGLVQLNSAEEYQKSANPIKCIIFLVLLVIIMLGILIAKHQPDKKK